MTDHSIQPLTQDSFAAFGDVLETAGRASFPINNGRAQRYNKLSTVDVDTAGDALINIFRVQPQSQPVIITMLERHPLGSQAFMPLNQAPFLIVVAAAGELDPDTIRVFLSNGQQGINYHRGTWHHPVIALKQETDFLVIDRRGPDNNCEERPLETPFKVNLDT